MPDPTPERPEGTLIDDLGPTRAQVASRRLRRGLGLVLAAGTAAALWGLWQLGFGAAGSAGGTVRGAEGEAAGPPAAGRMEGVYEQGDTLYVPTGEVLPDVVFVDSRPDDLEVRLEGTVVGRTPLVLSRHQEGDSARVELLRNGRVVWDRRVPVVDGGLRIDVALEATPPRPTAPRGPE